MTRHAAVDLGASSGRVVVGEVSPRSLEIAEVHRFANRPVTLPDGLHWDALGLYREVLDGLAAAARTGDVATVGVDSWAIDYGLLDPTGSLMGSPFHYRDGRTEAVHDKVHDRLSPAQLYQLNGLQHLPFTTIYQLAAEDPAALTAAGTLLLIPDLLGYWLTGVAGAEITNASTTGLLDVHTRTWAEPVLDVLGLPPALLPPLRAPGTELGGLLAAAREATGLPPSTRVLSVGSHDTASAVVAVPMAAETAAYVSLGTWGLVGVELEAPVLTAESRAANFTNELGVDGRVRYLRNVMGLWLLQESVAAAELPALLAAAADRPPAPQFDVDDPSLLPPGDMPSRIRELLRQTGAPVPEDTVGLVRSIVDSLAAALARTVADAARLSGRDVDVVHVVGGGAQNALLCQLLADRCGRAVVAGPVEATAIGNLLVQARAAGTLTGDLDVLRALVRATQELHRFEPRA